MKKLLNALMATIAIAVFSWPSVCFGREREEGRYIKFDSIDAQDFFAAKEDSCAYNLYPKAFAGDSVILDEFISRIVEIDDDARWIYAETGGPNDELSYELFEITSGDTTIYLLKFCAAIDDFCYLATKAVDGKLCISDERIDCAPIVISKDGYIAGFEQTNDAFYVRLTLCEYSIDKTTGNISITIIGTFVNDHSITWRANWLNPNPSFWHADTLYIEGINFADVINNPHGWYDEPPHYYKLKLSDVR